MSVLRHTFYALIALAAVLAPSAHAGVHERPDLLRHFTEAGTTGTMVVHQTGAGRRRRSSGQNAPGSGSCPPRRSRSPTPCWRSSRGGKRRRSALSGTRIRTTTSTASRSSRRRAKATSRWPPRSPTRASRSTRASPAKSAVDDYERAVRQMHYGNRKVADAPLDSFWLEGPFAISAREQVRFLERLRRGVCRCRAGRWRGRRDDGRRPFERLGAAGEEGYVFTTSPEAAGGSAGSSAAAGVDLRAEPRHHRPEHFAARASIGRAILTELGAFGP